MTYQGYTALPHNQSVEGWWFTLAATERLFLAVVGQSCVWTWDAQERAYRWRVASVAEVDEAAALVRGLPRHLISPAGTTVMLPIVRG